MQKKPKETTFIQVFHLSAHQKFVDVFFFNPFGKYKNST